MPTQPKKPNPELNGYEVKQSNIVEKLTGLKLYIDYTVTREQYYRDRS